jgi:hypothetical protein
MRKFSLKRKIFSETLQNQSFSDDLILIFFLMKFWQQKQGHLEGTFYLWIMPWPQEKAAFMAPMSLSHPIIAVIAPTHRLYTS